MKNLYLYLIIFISGAAVLAVEILGTRILGPFYGVRLFLWSALITVTLAALSLGYAVGGRWADKNATLSRLCTLVAGAGVWLLLIPWIKQPLLKRTIFEVKRLLDKNGFAPLKFDHGPNLAQPE